MATQSESQLPADLAFSSLSQSQRNFIQSLPKAELHAHLNGCIPLACLQELLRERQESTDDPLPSDESVQKGLDLLMKGVELAKIDDFFTLFPAIYALTSNPTALARATSAVLQLFLSPNATSPGDPPQCAYLELRTTPRETPNMTRKEYLGAVLDEVEKFDPSQAALLVSVDRRMSEDDVAQCVDIAIALKQEGRRVVGIDVCGDPRVGTDSY